MNLNQYYQALKGKIPKESKFFIVTWNYILMVPPLYTLVTSLPSFLDNNSVGAMYSAFLPLIQPKIYESIEDDIGENKLTYRV